MNPTRIPVVPLVLLCTAHLCPAFFGGGGFGAVSVVADAPAERHFSAQMARWSQQLADMAEVVRANRKLVDEAREAAEIMGDPRRLAGSVLGIDGALENLRRTGRMDTWPVMLSDLDPGEALRRRLPSRPSGYGGIGETMRVLGADVERDASRYSDLAIEDRARDRLVDALRMVEDVEKRERALHERLYRRLGGSPTLSEVELIRTAIEASASRLEIARSQAARARGEFDAAVQARGADSERISRAASELEAAEWHAFANWLRNREDAP